MSTVIVTKHFPPEVSSKSFFLRNLATHLTGDNIILAPEVKNKTGSMVDEKNVKRISFPD